MQVRFPFKLFSVIFGLVAGLWVSLALWGALSPAVYLHYADGATQPVLYFFNDNYRMSRDWIKPGETIRFPMAMFPAQDSRIEISMSEENRNIVEINGKFSRADIYIDADAKLEAKIKRDFFARFQAAA